MRTIRKLSIAEQTAEHVREGIRSGRWRGELPGVLLLAKECDVSKTAMRDALHLLETEGLISAGRAGAHRTVLGNGDGAKPRRALRVMIFGHNPLPEASQEMRDTLLATQRDLEAAGHTVAFTAKSQSELRFDPERIAKLIEATPADAWVVAAAPREMLDVFMAQPVPAIALGGRCMDAPMASVYTDAPSAFTEATRQLIALGHRRIVLICPRFWRQPTPGRVVQAFTAELAKHGIAASDFNVPDFEPNAAGLRVLFESLFRVTPPTALIVEVAESATAAFAFLGQHGLAVPRDVSLVCAYADATLQWCDPPVAHLVHDDTLLVRRIVRWVRAVARGRADREAIGIPATFDPGGTIGPARVG